MKSRREFLFSDMMFLLNESDKLQFVVDFAQRPSWFTSRQTEVCRTLECPRAPQQILHSGNALPRRFFGRAGAAPVRLEAHNSAIAVFFKRSVLSDVIDNPAAHLHPFLLAVRRARDIFAVHVAESFFREMRIFVRIINVAYIGRVPGITIQCPLS